MITRARLALLAGLPVAIGACGGASEGTAAAPTAAEATTRHTAPANVAAPAGDEGERVIASYRATATFRSFDPAPNGSVYANFDPIAGHEADSTAMVTTPGLAAFLAEHEGRPVEVKMETVDLFIDPPGERMDQAVVRGASAGGTGDSRWWQSRTPEQRAAAEAEYKKLAAAMGS